MATAMGDSIRSKIGKLKKKMSVKQPENKNIVGQPINRSADKP
jgi:hypothetical protein